MSTNIQEESEIKCITIYEDKRLEKIDYSSLIFVCKEQKLRVCHKSLQ